MAKRGFYGGDPEKVAAARADYVLAVMEYDTFLVDLEAVTIELNREEN